MFTKPTLNATLKVPKNKTAEHAVITDLKYEYCIFKHGRSEKTNIGSNRCISHMVIPIGNDLC